MVDWKSTNLNEDDQFCVKVNDKLYVTVLRDEDGYTVFIEDSKGRAIHSHEVSDFEVEVKPAFDDARYAASNYLIDEVCSDPDVDTYVLYDDDSYYEYGITAKLIKKIKEDDDGGESRIRYHRVNILDYMDEDMRTKWLEGAHEYESN
jgi:hypothetical protein